MQKNLSEDPGLSADRNSQYNKTMNDLSPFDVANPDDDFHAAYWPMDKWVNDSSVADLLNTVMCAYPELKWDNPLSVQFQAMLSVFQNADWVEAVTAHYDYTIVDFMRLMFANWPELCIKKRYASALSAVIVSCLM